MDTQYTVKQLSALAGVSIRTLHYYDEIDLLNPALVGENGYRYYDDASLLRLQQILFYRELGFDLAQIKSSLDDPAFDLVSALQTYRRALEMKSARLNTLIQTVDMTILHVIGKANMDKTQIFRGFSKEKQKGYEEEAAALWGDTVTGSVKLWESYSSKQQEAILAEGDAIYAEIATNMDKGPESDEIQALLVKWHDHIRYFYEPSIEMLAGLGDMYHDHSDFNANFSAIHPDLPAFLKQAIAYYVDNLETKWLESQIGETMQQPTNPSAETEIYPMPSFPTLAVQDLKAVSQWYQDALGFQLVFEMPGEGGKPILVHLRWAKYADLLLVPSSDRSDAPKGVGITLTFAMSGGSVDALADRIKRHGVKAVSGPIDQPWNARELSLLDPDGFRLTFTEPINKQMLMDDVVENVKKHSA